MPAATAHRLCPHGIFLPPRIDYYAEVSREIREIFERFTPLVEPGHVQEFLDPLPVERLWGVGRQGSKVFQRLGIRTIGQLRQQPGEF